MNEKIKRCLKEKPKLTKFFLIKIEKIKQRKIRGKY